MCQPCQPEKGKTGSAREPFRTWTESTGGKSHSLGPCTCFLFPVRQRVHVWTPCIKSDRSHDRSSHDRSLQTDTNIGGKQTSGYANGYANKHRGISNTEPWVALRAKMQVAPEPGSQVNEGPKIAATGRVRPRKGVRRGGLSLDGETPLIQINWRGFRAQNKHGT